MTDLLLVKTEQQVIEWPQLCNYESCVLVRDGYGNAEKGLGGYIAVSAVAPPGQGRGVGGEREGGVCVLFHKTLCCLNLMPWECMHILYLKKFLTGDIWNSKGP